MQVRALFSRGEREGDECAAPFGALVCVAARFQGLAPLAIECRRFAALGEA
jgi:hypothetical protein